MRPVSTAAQMRALDAAVIEGLGLPGIALMELASRGVADVVRALQPTGTVLVLCGPGNNGGDGWAVARWLHGWGLAVQVLPLGEPTTGDAGAMARVARAAGVAVVDDPREPALVVDALFGTGLTRAVSGRAADLLRSLQGVPTVAVDIPSGLHADTGERLGPALRADHTVTFGRPKLGMFLRDGPALCGRVHVVDIGLCAATADGERVAAWLVEEGDARVPDRPVGAHKRAVGDLLVVAGSAAMAGAAVLACEGALAAGIGLIRLLAPRGAWPRLARLPAEVMVQDGGPGDVVSEMPLASELDRYSAVVVGPGLGGGQPLAPELRDRLARWWVDAPVPLLFDADALVATGALPAERRARRLLTPHEGEAARLLGLGAGAVAADRIGAVDALKVRGTTLLKGPNTLVADDLALSINPTGHPVLATGGSGDVLAGFVGALMARGLSAGDAARTGAWRHGRAGEQLAACRPEGWSAGDLPAALRQGWATSVGTCTGSPSSRG